MSAPSGAEGDAAENDAAQVAASMTTVLVKALRALGKAGQPDEGLRLAARAWSALRHEHPGEAERINGTMHFLARMPTSAPVTGTEHESGSTEPEE